MEIFQLNRREHPDEPFFTYFGLARGYAAWGDRTNAIVNWDIALESVPPSQKGSVSAFERAMAALKGD